MENETFTAHIGDEEVTVYQNQRTGLFYMVSRDGRHAPVDYDLIRTQTTSVQRLKYWRNRYGYTQSELAGLIHVSSPSVIMTWENGWRHPRKEHRRLLNAELSMDIYRD